MDVSATAQKTWTKWDKVGNVTFRISTGSFSGKCKGKKNSYIHIDPCTPPSETIQSLSDGFNNTSPFEKTMGDDKRAQW